MNNGCLINLIVRQVASTICLEVFLAGKIIYLRIIYMNLVSVFSVAKSIFNVSLEYLKGCQQSKLFECSLTINRNSRNASNYRTSFSTLNSRGLSYMVYV